MSTLDAASSCCFVVTWLGIPVVVEEKPIIDPVDGRVVRHITVPVTITFLEDCFLVTIGTERIACCGTDNLGMRHIASGESRVDRPAGSEQVISVVDFDRRTTPDKVGVLAEAGVFGCG